jgi:beta-glucosidase
VKHIGSKLPRPLQELKAFRRVTLQPGETKTVELPIESDSLRYWDAPNGAWVLEKDQVEIRVGPSSADTPLRTTLAAGG